MDFREIEHFLRTGEKLPAPELVEVERILLEHLAALHAFYGDVMGVRIARKHVGWYLATLPGAREFRAHFNRLEGTEAMRQRSGVLRRTLQEPDRGRRRGGRMTMMTETLVSGTTPVSDNVNLKQHLNTPSEEGQTLRGSVERRCTIISPTLRALRHGCVQPGALRSRGAPARKRDELRQGQPDQGQ
jgi:hypothetical protein